MKRFLQGLVFGLVVLAAQPAGAEVGLTWTKACANPWTEHVYNAFVYKDKIWVVNAYQLWSSSDGTSWSLVSQKINYSSNTVVFKNKIWMFSDIVQTSIDGKTWNTVPKGNYSGTSVVFNNKLWRIGQSVYCTDDGLSWTLVSSNFPLATRYGNAFAVFDGKMWVMGGEEGSNYTNYYNDVWYSSDGKVWTRATANAGWQPRSHLSAFVYDGKFWIVGGYQLKDNNGYHSYFCYDDIWLTTDGIQWTKAADSSPAYFESYTYEYVPAFPVLSFKNKLWMFSRGIYYFSLAPGVPQIMLFNNQTNQEGYPYTSPTPLAIQGTRPITWSLVSPQAGMTVDARTGVVTWPWPLTNTQPYRIRLRATNSLGAGETSWTLTVTKQPPPTLSVPTFAKGSETTVTWTGVPSIDGYTVQCDDAPDFASPLRTLSVSSTTLKYVFPALQDGKTYWYRVRGNKIGGLTAQWSNVTSCTQDATAPRVWMGMNDRSPEWLLPATVRLCLSAQDPGSRPSGLYQMRFSLDRKNWTPWREYDSNTSVWLGRTGTMYFYGQVSDRVGNITDISTTVAAYKIDAIYVDDDNVDASAQQGTLEHPYRWIQAAINASSPGQTIIVAPGTYGYTELNKNVFLRSANPQCREIVKTTIIQGGVQFIWNENESCVLAGFTITKGSGIHGNGTKAAILYNIIKDNESFSYTRELVNVSPNPEHPFDAYFCHFSGTGGGIAGCNGLIANNIITNNRNRPSDSDLRKYGDYFTYEGEGTALLNCSGTIVNNTIWKNIPETVEAIDGCSYKMRNNIITGKIDKFYLDRSSYCCFTDALSTETANITGDPRLVDPANGDFRLRPDSPCIDAGCLAGDPMPDPDGDPRGYDGTADKRGDIWGYDIGADEYTLADQAVWLLEPLGTELLQGQQLIQVHWLNDPARTGSAFTIQLYRGLNVSDLLGTFTSNAAGDGTYRIRLPDLTGTYSLRISSVQNPSLFAQSLPFTLKMSINAAAPGAWGKYE